MATPTPTSSLESIGVTAKASGWLAIGETEQLVATAIYSDGSSADITDQATWSSYYPGVAAVNNAGLVTGLSAGTVEISATLDGKSGRFILILKPIPTPTLTPTPTPTSTPTPTAAAIPLSLIGGIIGGAVAAGAIISLYVKRRRRRR